MSESAHKLVCNMYKFLTSLLERKVVTGEKTWATGLGSFSPVPTFLTNCKVTMQLVPDYHHYIYYYIMYSFCVLYAIMYSIGLLYLLPDCPARHRFTLRGINRAPLSRHASHTSSVGEAIHTWAPFSWTASWLNGACSNSQPLDPPHTVFLSLACGSWVMRHIIWWRRKCK